MCYTRIGDEIRCGEEREIVHGNVYESNFREISQKVGHYIGKKEYNKTNHGPTTSAFVVLNNK